MSLKKVFTFFIVSISALAFAQDPLSLPLDAVAEDNSLESMLIEAKKQVYVGRSDKAIEILSKAYENNRSNATIAFELGKLYAETNNKSQAERYFKSAITLRPSDPWILKFYLDYIGKQDFDANQVPFFQSYTKTNATPAAYDLYIDYLIKGKDLKNLELASLEMTKHLGETENVLQRKYEICQITKCKDQLQILQKLITKRPDEKSYLKLQAEYYSQKNDQQKAKEIYQKILQLDPNDTDANLVIAKTSSNPHKAEASYLRTLLPLIQNESISVDAKVKELLPYLDNLMMRNDTAFVSELLALGDKLALTHTEDAVAQAFYGDVLYAVGRHPLAITQYQKTLKINKKNFLVWQNLIESHLAIKDFASSEKIGNQALDFFPNKIELYILLAKSYIAQNKTNEARSILKEALPIAGTNQKLVNTIQVYVDRLDPSDQVQKDLIAKAEKDPAIYEQLADLELKKGNTKQAVVYWKRALELGYEGGIMEKAFMRAISLK
jgi:tetratricopeptide (TPR) repeat protein